MTFYYHFMTTLQSGNYFIWTASKSWFKNPRNGPFSTCYYILLALIPQCTFQSTPPLLIFLFFGGRALWETWSDHHHLKGFYGDRYENFSDRASIWWQMSPYESLVWKNMNGEKKCFHIQMVTGMNLFQMVTCSNGDIFNLKWIVRIISNGDMFKWWHIEYDVNKKNYFKWWHVQMVTYSVWNE